MINQDNVMSSTGDVTSRYKDPTVMENEVLNIPTFGQNQQVPGMSAGPRTMNQMPGEQMSAGPRTINPYIKDSGAPVNFDPSSAQKMTGMFGMPMEKNFDRAMMQKDMNNY